MHLRISPSVREKLKLKHGVSEKEILECFLNREGDTLEDDRDNNKTIPPTQRFVALTNKGRVLKVCFVETIANIEVKTAYDANSDEIRIYAKYC